VAPVLFEQCRREVLLPSCLLRKFVGLGIACMPLLRQVEAPRLFFAAVAWHPLDPYIGSTAGCLTKQLPAAMSQLGNSSRRASTMPTESSPHPLNS
jgi:hypothetical protein